MNTYNFKPIYLSCTYDHCKSFYNKAYYVRQNNELWLYSYNTHVLTYNNLEKCFSECEYYPHSRTTNRHIREFKRQIENGLIA